MISTGSERFLEWRKAPKYLVSRMKRIYVRVSSLGSGSQVLSDGREQGWDIPSAPFRDGSGICPLPLPTSISTKEKRALLVCIWSVPSWQALSKGISGSAVFALAELGSCCAGSALWDRADTQKVKSTFQASPPQAGSSSTGVSLGFPELLSHCNCLEGRLFLPWE